MVVIPVKCERMSKGWDASSEVLVEIGTDDKPKGVACQYYDNGKCCSYNSGQSGQRTTDCIYSKIKSFV